MSVLRQEVILCKESYRVESIHGLEIMIMGEADIIV